MHSCYAMTRIARNVLHDHITVQQALTEIQQHCSKQQDYTKLELLYETFPTRLFILPLMAATCATVFFNGTWYDFGFASVCGLVAGIVASICTKYSHELLGVMDYLVATLASGSDCHCKYCRLFKSVLCHFSSIGNLVLVLLWNCLCVEYLRNYKQSAPYWNLEILSSQFEDLRSRVWSLDWSMVVHVVS